MTPNEFILRRFNATEGKIETLTPNEYQKLAMREILFKGKCMDTGEWVEGSYLPKAQNTNACIMWHEDGHIVPQICAIIPETVGQYIGANDKNHKEIFEGDIVKSCDNCIYEIRWDNQRAMFYLRNDITHISADFYHYFASDLEIIGNIHDNPRNDGRR